MKKVGKSKRRRLNGGGRKTLDEDMKEDLLDWISDLRALKLCLSRRMIREKAKVLVTTTEDSEFTASRGWLDHFMK